jgi:hypothetical protein
MCDLPNEPFRINKAVPVRPLEKRNLNGTASYQKESGARLVYLLDGLPEMSVTSKRKWPCTCRSSWLAS